MTLTPEQEAEWFKQLDQRDLISIRDELNQGKISSGYVNATYRYLAGRERESLARDQAFKSEQIEIARSAAADAKRASDAAERQATAAERANTRATIALVIAIISMIISAAGILWSHLDVDDGQKNQAKVQTQTH